MKWDDAYTKKQGVIFLQSLTGGTGIGTGGAVRVYIFDRSSNSWYYETELTPSGVVAGDSFGNAVSVSGQSVLVGATGQDTGGSLRGAAYIFNWDPSSNSYYQKAMLQAADTDSGDYFGNSVALDGNFAAIGSYNHDLPASNAGAVYIFGYNSYSGTWGEGGKIQPGDIGSGDKFGTSVALSGKRVIAGAPYYDTANTNAGGAWIYVWDPSSSSWYSELVISGGTASELLGSWVDIDGNTAVVAAPGYNSSTGKVLVYMYDRSANNWNLDQTLTTDDGIAGDQFGYSVNVDGNMIIVGTPYNDDEGTNIGKSYVFHRDPATGNWEQKFKVYPNSAPLTQNFGHRVSISNGSAIVAAPYSDETTTNTGSIFTMNFNEELVSDWSEKSFSYGTGASAKHFGQAMDVHNDTAIISAPANNGDIGQAFIQNYDHDGTGSWATDATLYASDGASGDFFGWSVAIHGDWAAVGAPNTDQSGSNSGAVYTFKFDPSGNSWTQQTKSIAKDGQASDYYGQSVDIHGNMMIVGAPSEDTNASNAGAVYFKIVNTVEGDTHSFEDQKVSTGTVETNQYFGKSVGIYETTAIVGSPGYDGGVTDRGRVRILQLDPSSSSWYTEATLYASDNATGDQFGYSVDISSGMAVIGAPFNDDDGTNSGSAYVYMFDPSSNSWSQDAILKSSDAASYDYFGSSVAIDGWTIVVGAYGDGDAKSSTGGAAYVFQYNSYSNTWVEIKKLAPSVAPETGESRNCGGGRGDYRKAVAVSDQHIIMGCKGENAQDGSAWYFHMDIPDRPTGLGL
ncbi:MAG: hypothetical protein HOE90_04860 [Bacteriovoracaceae bacterium]|nr:hypothetical protein [Bacteriovoracaceae bacterium]